MSIGPKDLTASSLIVRTLVLLSLVQVLASWLYGLLSLGGYPSDAFLDNEIEGQRRSINRRISEGGAYWQHLFQPEGMLFTYAFYSYGLICLAVRRPHDAAFRDEVLVKLESLIPLAVKAADAYPFSLNQKDIEPAGGVIAAGNANLMRAGYALLGGRKPEILQDFHRSSKEISDAYATSKWPALASFSFMPERWSVDNCSAIESMRLHDKLFGTQFMKAAERFMTLIASDIDKESGMMNAGFYENGGRADVPRGCALSWSLAQMKSFAMDFSDRQYDLYRRNWVIPVIGTVGIREWWPGQQKFSKISEGPVVFDIGAAASGLGLVAARVHGDHDAWLGLWRGLESIGFPSWNILGEKSYFGELFLLADTISFWSKTACVWDRPAALNQWEEPSQRNWQKLGLDSFWIPQTLAVLISAGLLLIAFKLWSRSLREVRARGIENIDSTERKYGAVQLILLAVHLLLPNVLWIIPMIPMIVLRIAERWQLTVRQLRQL